MRKLRFDAVLVQAAIAGALSFAHLHDLANAAGQHGWKAWAYPVSVDLLLVAAWRRMRATRTTSTAAPWAWFAISLAASLGANVATAGLLDLHHVPAVLRVLVAGWPALAFLGGTLLAHTPTPNTPDTPPEPEPESEPDTESLTVERVPDPAPELPAAAPEPAPEPDPAPVPAASALRPALPAVPVALIDHARKVADAHRTATGADIDTDTLRARLGVPPILATAIAAQLT